MLPLDNGRAGSLLPVVSPRGEAPPGPTDGCLLTAFLLIGGFLLNSAMGCSGYCFKLPSNFWRCFSALSHLVTSKLALAFCSRASCLMFSFMSFLSLMRFRSSLRDDMLREWGCIHLIEVRAALLSSLLTESVTERADRALFCRLRLLLVLY